MGMDTVSHPAPSQASQRIGGALASTGTSRRGIVSRQILAIAMLAALGAMSVVPFIKRPQTPDKHMVTLEYLRRSDGMTNPQLRLAILGQVFDVSRGRKHYGEGGSYRFFVGKDASRAYATGDFQHDLNDSIESLQPDQLASIVGWRSFYAKGYPLVGRLPGRFYAADGSGTELLRWVEAQAASAPPKQEELRPPDGVPCTVQWAQGEGVVSCGNGQHPRRMAIVNSRKDRCLCYSSTLFSSQRQLFPDCQPDASQCTVTSV